MQVDGIVKNLADDNLDDAVGETTKTLMRAHQQLDNHAFTTTEVNKCLLDTCVILAKKVGSLSSEVKRMNAEIADLKRQFSISE